VTELTHDDAVELLGAYALDATVDDDVRALESHILGCPECAHDLTQLRTVVAMIANSGGDASSSVWDAIAARLDDEPVVVPALPVHRLRPRARSGSRRVPLRHAMLAAVAAMVAMGALSAVIVHMKDQTGPHATTGNYSALEVALDNPHSEIVTLVSPHNTTDALARIVILPSGKAYLFDPILPRIDRDRTYQLWVYQDGRSVSIGLLGSDPHVAEFVANSPSTIKYYALTIEHVGGANVMNRVPVAEGFVQGV
jgi:hypothetical protein